jgi:hypothetical protein
MKLHEIAQEESPAGDKQIELQDLVKNFPNTYTKAVVTLAKSGRLTFGGKQVFTKSGEYGPALEQAVASAEALLKDKDTTVDVNIEMDGSVADIDEHAHHNADFPVDEFQEVYAGYSPRENKLVIGFDVWLDEEIFNQDWDKNFEDTFGEDFDHSNPAHEKIFNKAHKEFQKTSFMGIAVEVNESDVAKMDMSPFSGGFYQGAYPELRRLKLIDLRLD